MEPLATPTSLDVAPLHVIAVVLAAGLIGLIGVAVRRFLVASGFELGDLARQIVAHVSARAERRRMRSETPWLCARCRSHNRIGAARCYRCGSIRGGSELKPPEGADEPAGAGAGLATRGRRRH
jgi:hypothetical protein